MGLTFKAFMVCNDERDFKEDAEDAFCAPASEKIMGSWKNAGRRHTCAGVPHCTMDPAAGDIVI